ncbi:MAG TPA: glycosyltransferase [Candidatus Obscuribacterales bacterium]
MKEQLVGLRQLGHRVYAAIESEGPLSEDLRREAVPYEVFPLAWPWQLNRWPAFFRQIYHLSGHIYRHKYDVVHYHLFHTSVISRIAAWIADCPVRINMIPDILHTESKTGILLQRTMSWMDSCTVASCQAITKLCRQAGVPDDKLELIYYGPCPDRFQPGSGMGARIRHELGIPLEAPLVGMVAYFYPKLGESDTYPRHMWGRSVKNHELLIEAVPLVLKRIPEAKFLLVGDGFGSGGREYFCAIRQMVAEKGLDHAVIFAGHRKDVAAVLEAIDVSVQCSSTESVGGSIESLLMEKPLVVTNVGGLIDAVRHEHTGLVVDTGNHEQLAGAIIRLLSDRQFARRLGKNGRALMLERFCLPQTVDRLNGLYLRLHKENGASGYRWYVYAWRRLAALPIITALAWYLSRRDIINNLSTQLSPLRGRIIWLFTVRGRFILILIATTVAAAVSLPSYGKLASLILPGTFIWQELRRTNTWNRRMVYPYALALGLVLTIGMPLTPSVSFLSATVLSVLLFVKLLFPWSWGQVLHAMIKRAYECAIATILLVLTLPVALAYSFAALLRGSSPVTRETAYGKYNRPFEYYSFRSKHLSWIPGLWLVVMQKMHLVGPRLRLTAQYHLEQGLPASSWRMAPGLVSWAQLKGGPDASQAELDAMDQLYMGTCNPILDAKLMLKLLVKLVSCR